MARAANGTVIVRLCLREQVDILKQLAEASEEQHDHPNVIKYIHCWERGSLLFITIKFIVRSARICPCLAFVFALTGLPCRCTTGFWLSSVSHGVAIGASSRVGGVESVEALFEGMCLCVWATDTIYIL